MDSDSPGGGRGLKGKLSGCTAGVSLWPKGNFESPPMLTGDII